MKYKYNDQWKEVTVKAGDTLPIGTIVDYDGDTVPIGYEEARPYLKKLWENNSPESRFVAQNIVLSSSDYDYLIWFFKANEGWNRLLSAMTLKGYGVDLYTPDSGQLSDGQTWRIANFHRRVDRIDDITFSVPLSVMATPNNDNYAGNNLSNGGWCIPIAVYGGKF